MKSALRRRLDDLERQKTAGGLPITRRAIEEMTDAELLALTGLSPDVTDEQLLALIRAHSEPDAPA